MMTRILKSSYLLLFFAAFAFVACEKEEAADLGEVTSEAAFTEMEESGQMGCRGCFSIVYPVTLVFEDGTTAAVDGPQAIREALRAYVAENGRPGSRPEFEYPYDVELEDGTIQTLNSKEDFLALLQECGFEPGNGRPGFGRPGFGGPGPDRPFFLRPNPCYSLVFPVTVEFPNGRSLEVDNRAELLRLIRRWNKKFEHRPRRPRLQFPFEVELSEDGTLVTIEDIEGLRELLQGCRENIKPCFTINYPVNIALPDGSSQEANSREEAIEVFRTWRQSNPTSSERPQYEYPLEVRLTEDDSTLTVETPEELQDLVGNCRG